MWSDPKPEMAAAHVSDIMRDHNFSTMESAMIRKDITQKIEQAGDSDAFTKNTLQNEIRSTFFTFEIKISIKLF